MSEAKKAVENAVITVAADATQVFCPPKDAELWSQHPRVYMDMTDKTEVTCPYCSNVFAKK